MDGQMEATYFLMLKSDETAVEVVSMFISWKSQGCKNDNTNILFDFISDKILYNV